MLPVLLRVVALLCGALGLSGCVNLPPALERELECPAAGAPNHFGNVHTCPPSAPAS